MPSDWHTFTGLIVMIGSVGLAALGGCEHAQVETQPVVASAANSSDEGIAPDGAITCPIVCVSEIAKGAQAHAGRVAIRGVVSKVFVDRRAFTVANIVEGASCCPTGCGHDTVPARVPAEHYAGDLPEAFQRVIVVGEVIPNDAGYDFVIEEVWSGGKLVVKRTG